MGDGMKIVHNIIPEKLSSEVFGTCPCKNILLHIQLKPENACDMQPNAIQPQKKNKSRAFLNFRALGPVDLRLTINRRVGLLLPLTTQEPVIFVSPLYMRRHHYYALVLRPARILLFGPSSCDV